jgi:hypothetical protein
MKEQTSRGALLDLLGEFGLAIIIVNIDGAE